DGGFTASCILVVGFPMVDLGLSVKWAQFNVGATTPEGYGDYFAWGETEPKEDYSWETYKWCMGSENTLTKYCDRSDFGYNGFTDSKTVLEPEDDAATVNWGGSWRMPTYDEWNELIATKQNTNYKWTWKTINGHNGWEVFYLINGNSIFLPAAGFRYGSNLDHAGSYVVYCSSSLSTDYYYYYFAPTVCFNASDVYWSTGYGRFEGNSVRPVSE
ncbi:MAG: hypothetical protein IJS62_08230, partial [Bacteroidales bacterium]|nr:hypothetical protein [Bacteroidales bacterium]